MTIKQMDLIPSRPIYALATQEAEGEWHCDVRHLQHVLCHVVKNS